MTKEILKWADKAMFQAEAIPEEAKSGPQVTLLAMNHDPLGQIAATSMMYEGRVIRNLDDITDEERNKYFEQIKKTHLKMPFETVQMHFLIEGVTRSFTHQMVRQRTAAYAQESMRFAVVDGEALNDSVGVPPSLLGLSEDDPRVLAWAKAIEAVGESYDSLIGAGIPAEDARGLLPHAVKTRLHYITSLRGLQEHLGNRLCTQAQFEWRQVAIGIVTAIRNCNLAPNNKWQFEAISEMFRPVCYLTGKCEFMASFDRHCSIRDRVTMNHENGRDSSEWGTPMTENDNDNDNDNVIVPGIHPAEWLLNPDAARRK